MAETALERLVRLAPTVSSQQVVEPVVELAWSDAARQAAIRARRMHRRGTDLYRRASYLKQHYGQRTRDVLHPIKADQRRQHEARVGREKAAVGDALHPHLQAGADKAVRKVHLSQANDQQLQHALQIAHESARGDVAREILRRQRAARARTGRQRTRASAGTRGGGAAARRATRGTRGSGQPAPWDDRTRI